MKQITENYCNKEISVLLREKGFDEKTLSYYQDNVLCHGDWFEWNRSPFGHIAAPTHQMALKWLREMYKLFIEIVWIGYENMYSFNVTNMKDGFIKGANIACSYNEAVEAALLYVLKNLI